MPASLRILSSSADMTRQIGEAVGSLMGAGGYICLYGELGAGKTTFAQGLASGLGVGEKYITSPSFALVNEYKGRLRFYHIDLYRLSGSADLEAIGFAEYPGADGAAAVEWPERAQGLLPDSRLDVHIGYEGEGTRAIMFQACGKVYERLLEEICRNPRWSGR